MEFYCDHEDPNCPCQEPLTRKEKVVAFVFAAIISIYIFSVIYFHVN